MDFTIFICEVLPFVFWGGLIFLFMGLLVVDAIRKKDNIFRLEKEVEDETDPQRKLKLIEELRQARRVG